MKSNFFILIAIVFLSLFCIGALTSCSVKGPEFNTTALIIDFVENAPPKEVNYGVTFPIYAEVNNYGGYDIPAQGAEFYLSGIGENLIGVQTKLSNTNVLAKKTAMQPGGSEVLNFATNAQAARQLPSVFNMTLKLSSCYVYATTVQTSICVGKGSSVCSISGNKIVTGSNSAAPLQVTELTEQVQGNKLFLSFMIQNKGSGEVYLSDADCTKLEQQDINEQLKQNKVNIVVRTESGFACNLQAAQPPYSSIKTMEGIAQQGYKVTCEKTLTDSDSHLSPIEIVLGYKYRESTTKSLSILPS